MKLPGGWHVGSAVRYFRPFCIRTVLEVGRDRIVAGEGLGAPMWLEVHSVMWRRRMAAWQKLRPGPGAWWAAQHGETMVVVGYGRRPAMLLRQGSWRGIVPLGHGATTITLPSAEPCQVMVATSHPKRVAN